MTTQFREEDKIRILLWCDRHCCLCDKACGTDIEIAHIDRKAEPIIDNAIPLCYDCHAKIGRYNKEHPKGNKYRPSELKARREQIYERYTRHLVPPIHFEITQIVRNNPTLSPRNLPDVGFNLGHLGDYLPVRVRVKAKTILGGKDLGLIDHRDGYYSGKTEWNVNPRTIVFGHFIIPTECVKSAEDLKVEVQITIIDQYEREHRYLPQCWSYVRNDNYWFLEPRSFTRWA